MRLTPEQLIDQLYGPPKKEGQKKLEDFKNKGVPKPERVKGKESVIYAESPEGQEIIFNMEQIKQESINLYQDLNLTEFVNQLKDIEIALTPEQIETIKEKTKDKESGFNKFYLMPSQESQQEYLNKIKEETEKPMPGLPGEHQYQDQPDSSGQKGIWLSDTVKPNFPDKLQLFNRPENKPYLLFIQDSQEVPDQTKNQTPDQLRLLFQQRNETGLTLSEYLLFQRDYTQRHQKEDWPHPDTQYWTWLLDSEVLQQGSGSAQVLSATWYFVIRRVGVSSIASGIRYSGSGARSSAIFEIL